MLRKILIWLGVILSPRPHRRSAEAQARLDRLDEQWHIKWRR